MWADTAVSALVCAQLSSSKYVYVFIMKQNKQDRVSI